MEISVIKTRDQFFASADAAKSCCVPGVPKSVIKGPPKGSAVDYWAFETAVVASGEIAPLAVISRQLAMGNYAPLAVWLGRIIAARVQAVICRMKLLLSAPFREFKVGKLMGDNYTPDGQSRLPPGLLLGCSDNRAGGNKVAAAEQATPLGRE